MSGRRLFLPMLLVIALLAQAAPAFAAAPPAGPMSIKTEDFEAVLPEPTGWSLDAFNPPADPPAAAFWGRITGRPHLGVGSLWVAGTNANLSPRALGLYPSFTRGVATLPVPQLADYYSSTLSYYYNLRRHPETTAPIPDMGAADSLVAVWANSQFGRSDSDFPITGTNMWAEKRYTLSNPLSDATLSRRAGTIEFQFMDQGEGPSQWPTSGQGFTIDDVSLAGYKFGPVRSLSAARVPGGVQLNWEKPYGATGSTTEDTRSVAYKVWRSRDVKPYEWTELTTPRITAKSYLDTSAPAGTAYRYFVQAWDIVGNGERYGEGDPNSSASTVAIPAGAADVLRVAGVDRVDTALMAAQSAFPTSAPAVVVASGWSWTDALPGSALAGAVGGPLLLVRPTVLDASVKAEITRLGAGTVYVLGNTTSVNATVRNGLKAMTGVNVVEVGGTDVYSVTEQIAARVKAARGGTTGGTVYVARSDIFADALAASSLAAKAKAPIILVPKSGTIPAASNRALRNIAPATVVICGSEAAVDANVAGQLQTITGKVPIRKGGAGRYDTAKLIIEYGTTLFDPPDGIYIATGRNYPDALSGGVLAGASASGKWRPLMTTEPLSLVSQASGYINDHGSVHFARVLGSDYVPATGAGAVDDAVVTALGPLVQ